MTTTSDSAATTSKSLWRLSGVTGLQLARNALGGLRRNDAIGRASQLAFDFLFALFPLILLIVTMFGIFTSRSADLRNDFLSYFANFLPPGAFEVLRTTTDELAMNASSGDLVRVGRDCVHDYGVEPGVSNGRNAVVVQDSLDCDSPDASDVRAAGAGVAAGAGERRRIRLDWGAVAVGPGGSGDGEDSSMADGDCVC